MPTDVRAIPAQTGDRVLYSVSGGLIPLRAKDAVSDAASSVAAGVSMQNILQRPHTRQLRAWSRSNEWIRAAIRKRRSQLSSAQFVVGPIDPEKPYNAATAAEIEHMLRFPNPRQDSFRTLIEPVVEDYLVVGWGVIEKEQNARRQPLALYTLDASRLHFNPKWDGRQPNAPRYYYLQGNEKIPLRNDQAIVLVADPSSDRPEGLSTLDVLKNTIDAELAGSEWARDHMRHQAPNGLLHLGEEVAEGQVEKFKAFWDSEIAGRRAIAITGGTKNPSWTAFTQQAGRDLLQWQLYFIRKICAVFEISPQDIGVTFDINKATAESQAQITHDAGLVPLLLLVEEYLNREFVWQIAPIEQNIRFTFTQLNDTDRLASAELVAKQNSGLPYITINEARKEDGRDPIEGGDVIMVLTQGGAIPMLGEGIPTPAEQAQQRADLAAAAADALAQGGTQSPANDAGGRAQDNTADEPKGKPPATGKAALVANHAPAHYRASLAPARRTCRQALSDWYLAQLDLILADLAARRRLTAELSADPQQSRSYLAADLLWAVERAVARDRVATSLAAGPTLTSIILAARIAAGTQAIQDELDRLDAGRTADLTDAGLLTRLQLDAEQAVLGIHRTLRSDASSFITHHLPAAGADPYDDTVALLAVRTWLEHRAAVKANQISLAETGAAAAFMLREFVRRNGLEGTGRCVPDGAVCTTCGDFVGAGEVPLDEALSWPLPNHPYCPHYVEARYDNPPDSASLWAGH